MAVQTAGSARYRHRIMSARRRLLMLCVIVLVVAVAAFLARPFIFHKKTVPTVNAAKPVLSTSAKQSEDVDLVAGAVGQYAAANGALPTHLSAAPNGSLVLCGDTCNPTLYSVSGFSVYQASNIHLMSYAPGLSVPNQNVMYLVPGAKCGSNGQLGSVNPAPRSMVLLYASAGATSTAQRCVVL